MIKFEYKIVKDIANSELEKVLNEYGSLGWKAIRLDCFTLWDILFEKEIK